MIMIWDQEKLQEFLLLPLSLKQMNKNETEVKRMKTLEMVLFNLLVYKRPPRKVW